MMNCDQSDSLVLTDIFLVRDTEEFLEHLRFLIGEGDTILDALAEVIAEGGRPDGANKETRSWVIELLSDASERTQTAVAHLDVREVVTDCLRDRYAELATCVDPVIGGGDLTLRSAAMLRAFIATSAERVIGVHGGQSSWGGVEIPLGDLSAIGIPLLGTKVAGYSPFRLISQDMTGGHLSAKCHDIVDTLLWVADAQSQRRRSGAVIAPQLGAIADLLVAPTMSGVPAVPPS